MVTIFLTGILCFFGKLLQVTFEHIFYNFSFLTILPLLS